ncbi:FAD-dependent oxidoreductase [Kytococcus schroeteri]|uniref:FAD-dependent oxidoreductase n=1 Tax=Kytococcus schroeteri TaxID=138300 RepID=UPI00192D878D|nr:FAD-dependent oxidoreductase [Kytococcus schroeteri]
MDIVDRDVEVVVVGAGPVGMATALRLRQSGVEVLVVDRQAEGDNSSRAAVVHAATLEALKGLGVTQRLLERGIRAPRFSIRDGGRVLLPLDFRLLPSSYAFALMVSQADTERVLADRLREEGVEVWRPVEVAAVADGARTATVSVRDLRAGRQALLRARYVVGADGMGSLVRRSAGIDFPGHRLEDAFVLGDVRTSGGLPDDEVVLFFSPRGTLVSAPLPGGVHRLVAPVEQAPSEPSVAHLQELLDRRGPGGVRIEGMVWGSRFRVHERLADRYRSGRLVLAGDAAHVHSPAGGQGMNLGLRDAVALGDALAAALRGEGAAALEAYEARQQTARRVIRLAGVLTRAGVADGPLRAARNALLSLLARIPVFRSRVALRLSGLAE